MSQGLTVVSGGLVVLPSWVAERRDIVLRGDTIVDVVLPGTGPADAQRINAVDRAVLPGFVNAHVHGHGTLAKGIVEDRWPLEYFLGALPGLSGGRTDEDKYLNGLLGAVEMIRKGCTTACDLFAEFPAPTRGGVRAVAQAYADVGVRAVVAPMMADHTFYQAYPELLDLMPDSSRDEALGLRMADGDRTLDTVETLLADWPFDRDQIRPGIAPSIPLHCGDAFLTRCRDIARTHDVVLHTHLAESRVQAVSGLERYGWTITAHLERLGLLGPGFAAVHAIWLDDEDLRRLAGSGASVVHAPASNMRFGSGLAQVKRMRDLDINVGLATDGTNTSDGLNMFEAMRTGASISTMLSPDPERWLGMTDVFEMATTGSARAMGFAGALGRIEPGYKADLVLLDLRHINYVPLGNLPHQIVFGENGAAVDSVMIGGKLVMDQGRITTIDEVRLGRDAQAAADRLRTHNEASRALAARLRPAIHAFRLACGCRPYHVQRLACAPLPDPA